MIFTLKKPVQIGDSAPISTLTFREEICTGDMRGMSVTDLDTWDGRIKLASRLSGQTELVLNKTCLADGQAICNLIADFLKAGLEIGTEP